MEIVAGLLRPPSPISIDGSEACETFLYVFETDGMPFQLMRQHRRDGSIKWPSWRLWDVARTTLTRENVSITWLEMVPSGR